MQQFKWHNQEMLLYNQMHKTQDHILQITNN